MIKISESFCRLNTTFSYSIFSYHIYHSSVSVLYLPSCYNKIKALFLAVVIVLYHFYFNFVLFVHVGHANFDFNQCSLLTEWCFQLFKRLELSKSLLLRFSPPDEKSPSAAKFPIPTLSGQIFTLPVKAIWKTLQCHSRLAHELLTMKAIAFYAFSLFL